MVGAKPTELKQYLSVADTGAGPNLIRADCVPPEILANVNRDRRIVNLASASKHKLQTIGVVHLWMDIGGYACRETFVFVRRLASDVIIGCMFLYDHSESLQIRCKVLILTDGTAVPIGRHAAGIPIVVRTRSSRNENDYIMPAGPPDCALWHTDSCQIMLSLGMASIYRAPYAVQYTRTVYIVQRNTARRSIPVVRRLHLTLYHVQRGRRWCRSPGHVDRYDITIRSELRNGQGYVHPIYVNP